MIGNTAHHFRDVAVFDQKLAGIGPNDHLGKVAVLSPPEFDWFIGEPVSDNPTIHRVKMDQYVSSWIKQRGARIPCHRGMNRIDDAHISWLI